MFETKRQVRARRAFPFTGVGLFTLLLGCQGESMAPATAMQPANAAAALEPGNRVAGKEIAVRDTAVRAEKAIFAAG